MHIAPMIELHYPDPVDVDLTLLRDEMAGGSPKRRRWPQVLTGLTVAAIILAMVIVERW